MRYRGVIARIKSTRSNIRLKALGAPHWPSCWRDCVRNQLKQFRSILKLLLAEEDVQTLNRLDGVCHRFQCSTL